MNILSKYKYRILFLLLTVITVTFSPVFSANIIEKIEIRGNKNVPTEDIYSNLTIQEGDEYQQEKVSEDLTNLYGMKELEDVSILQETVSTGSIKIIYEVTERPLVNEIIFKGNEKLSTGDLKKKIEISKKDFFDNLVMEEDVQKLVSYYKSKGFADVEVEAYTTTKEAENKVAVTYFINEGKKIEIKELNFIGVIEGDYKKVSKEVDLDEGDIFKSDVLEEGLQKIEAYYKDNGYFNVNVHQPLITYSPERKFMHITIFIDENKKFYMSDINFIGNIQLTDEELSEIIEIEKGDIYSEKKLERSIQKIQQSYGEKGYIKAAVKPEFSFSRKENKISVDIEIREGPKVFVRNIYLEGNLKTRDYVIERELKIHEGEPFELSKVRKTQAEIYKLGFFKDIQIDMLPANSPDQTDIVFKMEEQKTGTASIGAGYSTQDSLVGNLQISQDNLMGRGQKLSAMWEFGSEKQDYRIRFSEPYLFNTRTPFSVSVYNTQTRKYYSIDDNRQSYNERRRGGDLSFGRHFTDDFSSSLKYSLEQVENYDLDGLEDIISDKAETVSSITPGLTYDTRDYPFNPRKGSYLSFTNQIAGGILGGSANFNKFESKTTYFQSIFWKFTGVINFNTGALSRYSNTSVPDYERFYIGGAESVRGYEYWDDIGPPGGGKYKLVGNAEIKFPIISERGQTVLQGAIFYDIGGVWNSVEGINLTHGVGKDDIKRGIGAGIRFKTRAFPIRLDWGYGLDKKPREGQWYFTLGDIF
ncbi:MAG: outer membrane protein assembly factor BamA [Elusimicrobiota bacterium]